MATSTSSASPNQDQLKVLEQTRQRLVQLTHSLESLAASLQRSDPLPSWTSLQSQSSIISNNLLSVSEQLSEHHELLSSLVAYPGPTFPGHTQAGVLEQLLRTKLEPRVEDWVAKGRAAGAGTTATSSAKPGDGLRVRSTLPADVDSAASALSEQQLTELWEWAPIAANQEARRRDWGGNFTLEEREMGVQNVVTGLKRRLAEEEEEESEEEEEEEEEEGEDEEEEREDVEEGPQGERMDIIAARRRPGGAGLEFDAAAGRSQAVAKVVPPSMPLDDVLRFMMTGAQPKSTG